MSFVETENRIEAKAGELRMVDPMAQPLTPVECRIQVAKYFDKESEALWSGIETRAISLEVYESEWMRLIEQMRSFLYLNRLEATLAKIRD